MNSCPIFLLLLFFVASFSNGETLHHDALKETIPDAKVQLEKATTFLYQYQLDSSAYYYQQIEKSSDASVRVSAKLGLTRISLLKLEVASASSHHLKITPELKDPGLNDSLTLVYKLNQALLSYLTSNSKTELEEFILQTPESEQEILIAYEWLVEILIEERHYQDADSALQKAFVIHEKYKRNDQKSHIAFLLRQASLCYRMSKLKQSLSIYEEHIFPVLNDRTDGWARYYLAQTYRMSARLHIAVRNYERALECNFQYIKIMEEFNGNSIFRLGEVYASISKIYLQLGFYSLSEEYENKSAQLYQSIDSSNELLKIRILYSKGLGFVRRNQLDSALRIFDSIIQTTFTSSGVKSYVFEAMVQKLQIQVNSGSNIQAKKTYDNTIAYLSNFSPRSRRQLLFRVKFTFLNLFLHAGDHQVLNPFFKEMKEMVDEKLYIQSTLYLSFMNQLSEYLFDQNDPDSALAVTTVVLKRYEEKLRNPTQQFINIELKYLVKTGFIRGRTLKQIKADGGDEVTFNQVQECFDQAITWHMLTKKGYKPLEDDLYSEVLVSDLFESAIEVNEKLFRQTGEKKYVSKVFEYTELYKSNQLLEALQRNLIIKNSKISESLLISLRSLNQQVSYLKNEIRKLSQKSALNSVDSLLNSDYKELLLFSEEQNRRLMVYLESNYNNYYDANYGKQFVELPKVQQKLKAGEGLITYFQGSNSLFSLLITSDTAVLDKSTPLATNEILSFRNSLLPDSTSLQADDSYRFFVNRGKRLYDRLLKTLFERVSEESEIRKLYIVPDKSLNFLPFEQLLTEDTEGIAADYGALPYLIKSYQVSYGASASVLFRPQSDEVLPDYSGKLLAFAPTYSSNADQAIQIKDGLSALRYNQQEAESIMTYFTGRVLAGKTATEKYFYQQVNNYDIFHFAMHGLVDLKEPQFSRLAFAEDQTDSVNDRYLHNFEIYNMDIPAQLVVLSACNTGIGQLIDGEGVMSMSRAFTYAGVQSVVMTQWPAEDQSSSEIMKSFYQYLASGHAKDESLRLAKLDYLSNAHPFKKNPFYWNNFIVTGQVQALQIKNSHSYLWWICVGGISLLAIIFVIRQRKTN
ncbi:MAG: CHAT domain-containing protein [Bacteroidota bacterium]